MERIEKIWLRWFLEKFINKTKADKNEDVNFINYVTDEDFNKAMEVSDQSIILINLILYNEQVF